MNTEESEKDIPKLNSKKASQYSDITAKIIKVNSDILSNFLWTAINSSIKLSVSLISQRMANVTPVYTKGKKV